MFGRIFNDPVQKYGKLINELNFMEQIYSCSKDIDNERWADNEESAAYKIYLSHKTNDFEDCICIAYYRMCLISMKIDKIVAHNSL